MTLENQRQQESAPDKNSQNEKREGVKTEAASERRSLEEKTPFETLLKNPEELAKAMQTFTFKFTEESLDSEEKMKEFLKQKIAEHITAKSISAELSELIATRLTLSVTNKVYKRDKEHRLEIKVDDGVAMIKMSSHKTSNWFAEQISKNEYQGDGSEAPEEREKTVDSLMSEAEIEMRRGAFRFTVGGVERSFKITPEFKASLEGINTADKIKLACYEELLRIITKDNSITKGHANYNKHRVAGGDSKKFETSNTALKSEIERLKAEPKEDEKPASDEQPNAESPAPGRRETEGAQPQARASISTEPEKPATPEQPPTFAETQRAKTEAITKTQEEILEIAGTVMSGMPAYTRLNLDTTKIPNRILLNETDTGYVMDIRTEDNMEIEKNGEFRVTAAVYKEGETPEYKTLSEWKASNDIQNEFGKAFGLNTTTETTTGPAAEPVKESTPEEKRRMEIERKNLEALIAERQKYGTKFKSDFDGIAAKAWESYKTKGYDINRLNICTPKVRSLLDRVSHQVDADFGKITEEKIREKFKETNGYKKIELILKTPPFSYNVEQAPKIFAAILSEGANDTVTLADVFEMTKEKLMANANGKIPADYFSSYIQFGIKLAEESLKKPQTPAYQAMIDLVLSPAQALIEAAKAMDIEVKDEDIYNDYEKGGRSLGQRILQKQKERRQYIEKQYESQKELLQGIFKLCGYDDYAPGDFAHIIALLHGGSKDQMTMADIDGKVFTVDEGKFKRYNSPVAAVYALTNQKGLYKLENGQKVLDEKAFTAEANRLIQLGYLNQFLMKQSSEGTADKRSIAEILKDPEFTKNLEKLQIKDFKNLSKEQIEAFQTGFLVSESSKFAQQFEVKDATGERIIAKHPALQKSIEELIKQGYKKEDISLIQNMVMSVSTGARFIEQPDGSFKLVNATIGTPSVKLSDGTSVSFDITANKEGEAIGSLNLILTLKNTKEYTAEIATTIGVQGFSAGLDQTIRAGAVDINAFAGVSWNWGNIIPTVGGRLVMSWNTQAGLKQSVATAEEKSRYKEAWAKWNNVPKDDIKGRFEILKSIPTIRESVKSLMTKFALTEADIVQMFENVKDQITEDALENYGTFMLISGVGIAMAGPVPMPVVQIKIGSALVSIPNRKELSRVLPTLSSKVISSQIDEAIAGMKETKFLATMPGLVYGRDGKLLTLIKSDEIDLSALSGNLDEYNKNLATAEVSLEKMSDGRIKLNIHNDTDKDVEVHYAGIDVENVGGVLYLKGDLSNLIISRERFTMPFERDEYKASVRDVIVIRRKSEHTVGMDSEWIQNYGTKFQQRLMKQSGYKEMTGTGVVDLADENVGTILPTGFGSEELSERKNALERRRKVTGSMEKSAYEAEAIRPGLFGELDNLYKDATFKKEFHKVTDNPEAIIKLIQKNQVNLNTKEANLAVIHLLNRHFTNLTGTNKGLDQIKLGIDRRIKWIKPIFQKRFEAGLTRLGEQNASAEASRLTGIFFKNMYDKLIQSLTTDKNFNYNNSGNVQDIPAGTAFYSGSRRWDEGQITRALDETIDYNKLAKPQELAHEFGFLTQTVTEYGLNSPNKDNAMIARLLLEIASPLPEDPKEFLRSKLALKIATTEIGVLLMDPQDYELITQLYEDPSKLNQDAHKAAFEKFKALVTEIRTKQLAGETFTKLIRQNITVEIKPSTKIVAGAYTKCGNSSFYVQELGEISIVKSGQVIGTYNATNDRIESKMGKITATIFGSVEIQTMDKAAPRKGGPKEPTEPERKGGGKNGVGDGVAPQPPGAIGPGASPVGSPANLGPNPGPTPKAPGETGPGASGA